MSKEVDKKRLDRILKILSENGSNLRVDEISKKSRIPSSSVYFYIHKHLKNRVNIIPIGGSKNKGAIIMYSIKVK